MYKSLSLHLILYALAFVFACKQPAKISSVNTAYVEISSANTTEDSITAKQIAPYKIKLDSEMNEVLAVTATAMMKGEPEGLLGNFVADLTLKKANEKYAPADGAKIDICMLNNGGLRTPLPKGEITRGKVYELMPFDNRIVVLTISGEKTMQMLEYLAAIGGAPVSGIQMGIKNKKPVDITVNGTAFDVSRTYKIVTSDYLANGGDKMSFFKDPVKIEDIDYLLRDAIIDYMKEENKKGNQLKAEQDRRLYHDK
jgi:2',3'-cyclic-nucleotide 2'-phosphodiesterase (5'-nucleotidase family)